MALKSFLSLYKLLCDQSSRAERHKYGACLQFEHKRHAETHNSTPEFILEGVCDNMFLKCDKGGLCMSDL